LLSLKSIRKKSI